MKALRNGKRWSRINMYFKYWKSLYKNIMFISRTYVLFFYEISLCILYIKCIKLCINIHLLKKIKKSILKIF